MAFDSDQRTPYRRKKRQSWVSPRTLGIFLLFLALVSMLYFSSREEGSSASPLGGFWMGPISIIQKTRNIVGGTFSGILDNFRAKSELEELRKELADLQRENGILMYRLRRFEAFQETLDLPAEEDFPTVAAIVIAHDRRMAHSFVINRGTVDGLKVNMAVWSEAGLVGRTVSLTQHAAKVQPITDSRSAIGVYIEGTPYEGILRGVESEKPQLVLTDLHLIGVHDEMNRPVPGQSVYTSGTGMVFPRNLLAGTISDATSDDGLVVEPVVDPNYVRSVLVITNTTLREETLTLLEEE